MRILTEAMHTADAVASLEADVVPPTHEELYRTQVIAQLDAIIAKLDALGSVLASLARKASVHVPQSAAAALSSRAQLPADRTKSSSSPWCRRRCRSKAMASRSAFLLRSRHIACSLASLSNSSSIFATRRLAYRPRSTAWHIRAAHTRLGSSTTVNIARKAQKPLVGQRGSDSRR